MNAYDRYGVCELKHSLASAILDVPLPNSAIIRGREYIVACFICSDTVYFVGVTDHRENNIARFTFPRTDKTVLIAGENIGAAEAETAHTFHLLLLLQGFRLVFNIRGIIITYSVENVILSIVNNWLMRVLELKQEFLVRSLYINF